MYGEEVIGKSVLVRFVVENDKHAWFKGRVSEVKWTMDDDDKVPNCHHRIAFGDGEDKWYNLEEWEERKELHWVRTDRIEENEIMNDAIGRCVLIEFPIQNKKRAWFQGKICTMRTDIMVRKKEKIIQEYLVVYEDDGGEQWTDLWKLAKRGKLQFVGNPPRVPSPVVERVAIKEEEDEVNSVKRKRSNNDQQPTPDPVFSSSKQKTMRKGEDDEKAVDWTKGMENWLRQTWGEGNEKIKHVMERVRMLATGTGLRCKSWNIDRRFFLGTPINLSCNLPLFLEHAKSLQEEFGADPDGGLDLIVPLEQMLRYKKSLLLDLSNGKHDIHQL